MAGITVQRWVLSVLFAALLATGLVAVPTAGTARAQELDPEAGLDVGMDFGWWFIDGLDGGYILCGVDGVICDIFP